MADTSLLNLRTLSESEQEVPSTNQPWREEGSRKDTSRIL